METFTDNNERARIAHLAATCACQNLRRASRNITNYYDALLKETGLRVTQIPMLVIVYLAGSQTINDMAEKLGLDRTTLTRNLKPLEHAGLLAVASGTDQRTRVVTLTENGKQKLLQVLPLWEQAQAHMVEGMGHTRVATLLTQLSDAAVVAHKD